MLDKKITKQWVLDAKLEAKAEEGDQPKRLVGYAATYEIDSINDKIAKGAFTRTIDNKVMHGKVALMVRHLAFGGDTMEAIGEIKYAKEDDYGLWVEAELYDTQLANETYEKIKKSPNMYGMSIGYSIVDYHHEGETRFLTEIKLYEVTVTMVPVNEGTLVNAKSKNELVELIKETINEMNNPADDVNQEDEEQVEDEDSSTPEETEAIDQVEVKSDRKTLDSKSLDRKLSLLKAKYNFLS